MDNLPQLEENTLAVYKFTITYQDGKRYIQCEMPPHDINTVEWCTALAMEMDNIYSYCKDMYEESKEMIKKAY